jgi:D-tyrosyl-tRNA(Tyr) deacylase
MRAVIQRVSRASVVVDGQVRGEIGLGLLVFLGIEEADGEEDVLWLAQKIARMRIFADAEGKMNASVQDVGGNILVVSQFTLHAQTRKGNRPSFIRAARPDQAVPLYETMLESLGTLTGSAVAAGEFGAMMEVSLVNDGPVTIWMDTKDRE